MEKFGSATITRGHDVETLSFDWGTIKMLSGPEATDAERMSFGIVVLEPGKGHERHNHPDSDEIIFVLSGEGEQMLNDEDPVPVEAGACMHIPKGVYHSTLNTGWEPLRLIIVYTPAGPEQALRDIPECTVYPAGEVPTRP